MKATILQKDILYIRINEYLDKNYQELIIMDYNLNVNYLIRSEMDIKIEETFSSLLLKMIDKKKLTDVEVYKKASIDRRLFSKIRSEKYYKPSKETCFSLILALELKIKEAKELLEYAGYTFNRSSKFDLIVKYCIEHQIYEILQVNEILFDYTNKTL